jgi:hypothetical protein
MSVELSGFSLDRMVRAEEKVRERLLRATMALEDAQLPYAVMGDDAVAAWVARVDESAVRNTRDVEMLIRREDLPRIRTALETAGFLYGHSAGIDIFLDGPEAKARDGVHVVFANEMVRPDEPTANPNVTDSESAGAYRVISLQALVQIKLTAYRDKDRTHVRDLIDVGLVDESWYGRLVPTLAARLRSLIETPGG